MNLLFEILRIAAWGIQQARQSSEQEEAAVRVAKLQIADALDADLRRLDRKVEELRASGEAILKAKLKPGDR